MRLSSSRLRAIAKLLFDAASVALLVAKHVDQNPKLKRTVRAIAKRAKTV